MRRNLATIDRNTWSPLGRLIQEAMAHGLENDMIYGGLMPEQSAMQALNVEQAVQNCMYGTRRVSWDGRVHKYSKVTLVHGNIRQGIKFYETLADGIDYVAPSQTQLINSSVISVVAANGVAVNELAGGYLIVHTHAAANHQFRAIVSNTAAAAGLATVITVETPFTIAIAIAHGVEIFRSPYNNLRWTDGQAHVSVAGIPVIACTVANYHQWVQTWGYCWGNPYGTTGAASVDGERRLTFDTAGNVCPATDNRYAQGDVDMQHAGFTINRTGAGTGYGLFMLQCSR